MSFQVWLKNLYMIQSFKLTNPSTRAQKNAACVAGCQCQHAQGCVMPVERMTKFWYTGKNAILFAFQTCKHISENKTFHLFSIITKKKTLQILTYTTKNGVGKMPSWKHFRFEHTPKNVGRKQLYIYIYILFWRTVSGLQFSIFVSVYIYIYIYGLYIVFKTWSVTSRLHLLRWSNVAP